MIEKMKTTYYPSEDIKQVASIYEVEVINNDFYLYRILSKDEIKDFYMGKSNIEPDEQGRTLLFVKNNIKEIEYAVNSYWEATRLLLLK